MARAHIWFENDCYFWDDAEDHGGFDRNVPTGPFDTRERAVADARVVFGQGVDLVEGRPPRYDEQPSVAFRR